ncbi:substrate-binding domain-containing protein [Acrocarpospora sp. B8E8]|uniref:LacI family DNA-binding transcriptional regulator n=1 Tax=Acrocarpospora sp. B8E8 TaxID=3153572 RepID=UPI00325F4CF6
MQRPIIGDAAGGAGASRQARNWDLPGARGQGLVVSADRLPRADDARTPDQGASATRDAPGATSGAHASPALRVLRRGDVKVVGLILPRPPTALGGEPFVMQLISGLEGELSRHGHALLLQTASCEEEEIGFYLCWRHERLVGGVVVCDLRLHDRRISTLEELKLPAVALGPPIATGRLPSVWCDDAAAMVQTVRYLAALGHRRIAYLVGSRRLAHVSIRADAFIDACAGVGIARAATVFTDMSGDAVAQSTRPLLRAAASLGAMPTALIYDNNIMAIAGLALVQQMGLRVPADLSILAWDDAPICALMHPPLTAMTRDVAERGSWAARTLLTAMGIGERTGNRDGGSVPPGAGAAAHGDGGGPVISQPAFLTVRGSTSAPPHSVEATVATQNRPPGRETSV